MSRPQFLRTLSALSFTAGLVVGCSPTGGTAGPVSGSNANGNANQGGQGSIEVLLPSSSGGNLAAIISSSNNELRVYGDHDGSGNVSELLGFEYMGPTGDNIRMGFGASTDANTRIMQGFTGSTYVAVDAPGGFLMQIDANADGGLDVIYYDLETGTGGEVKNLTSVITSCQSYLDQAGSFASDGGVEHAMAESVCFIKDALLCISAVGGATGVGGLAGQAVDFLDIAQDFVTISCEEAGSWLEVAGEAVDAIQEGFPGWIATVQQEIIDFVEGAVGGGGGGGSDCQTDSDCGDGRFCNGSEACVGGTCITGSSPCAAGQTCNEDTNTCEGTPPSGETLTLDLGGGVTMELVRIPGGTFLMGNDSGSYVVNNEQPVHNVTISKDFYIGNYEVTEAQWEAVMGSNPPDGWGCDDCYALASWIDAVDFTTALSSLAGYDLRLPTEAEWEYACRDGSGLHNMRGSAWEWCADVYHDSYQGAPTDGSAWTAGGDEQGMHVVRGGPLIWGNINVAGCARRLWETEDSREGFRVASGT